MLEAWLKPFSSASSKTIKLPVAPWTLNAVAMAVTNKNCSIICLFIVILLRLQEIDYLVTQNRLNSADTPLFPERQQRRIATRGSRIHRQRPFGHEPQQIVRPPRLRPRPRQILAAER